MKKIIYVSLIIGLVVCSFASGQFFNHYQTQKWLNANVATRSDIDKVNDYNYLQGVRDGTHCSLLKDSQRKIDQRCIDAIARLTHK